MRIITVCIVISIMIGLLIQPVSAMDFTAPSAPPDVEKYIPDDQI